MEHSESSTRESAMRRGSRRQLLGTVAGVLTTGLAGCLGGTDSGSEPTATETATPTRTAASTATTASLRHEQVDPFTEVRQTETRSTKTRSFEIPLEAGQFAQQELRIDQPSEVRIRGESTANMDVFLLVGEAAFEKYQAGESAIFSGGLTATGVNSIDRTIEVPAGRYFVVFDNTPVYGAAPDGDVNAKFEIVVSSDTPTATATETPTETATTTGENNAEIVSESDMPKIRTVSDNFGHTFVWDPEADSSEGFYPNVEDEVVVSDDTTVSLTVEEILADPEDTLSYSYVFGTSTDSHPDNTAPDQRVRSNTHTWEMRREDYSSSWSFSVYLRNEDDIYYQNEYIQTDFQVDVTYSNLTLE